MSKKLILIIAAAVLLGGGGTAAVFLLGGKEPAAEEETAAVQEPPGIVSLNKFLVNLADVDKDRYARLAITITVRPKAQAKSIQLDDLFTARLRDATISHLAAKTYVELTTHVGREAFREELLVQLSPLFENHEGELEDVLFTEFMVQ